MHPRPSGIAPGPVRRTIPSRHGYRGPVRIAFCNWRDTANPEGGGSEVYVERIAEGLAERGHEVDLLCAAHEGAPAYEERSGLRIHRGGTKLTVYSAARRRLRSPGFADVDVVVDTQNGIPFLTPWATRAPIVVLVHHVHREQWPVVYDPARARVGWWIESRLAPRVYRRHAYVAVSQATRHELADLGIDPQRITIVHNGTTVPVPPAGAQRSASPTVLVLGRLVPHKRVEHVLDAAALLRSRIAGLRVDVVGDGWWASSLRERSRDLGLDETVRFHGHVDEQEKARLIASAWVLAVPSLKEGWGQVILEAASLGVPAIAYREAGGVTESIVDGTTGILVGDETAFAESLGDLCTDERMRSDLGAAARRRALQFSWESATDRFEEVLERAVSSSSRRPRRARPHSAAPRSARR